MQGGRLVVGSISDGKHGGGLAGNTERSTMEWKARHGSNRSSRKVTCAHLSQGVAQSQCWNGQTKIASLEIPQAILAEFLKLPGFYFNEEAENLEVAPVRMPDAVDLLVLTEAEQRKVKWHYPRV
jgi:hypothetical protein